MTKIPVLSDHENVTVLEFYLKKFNFKALLSLTIKFRIYEFQKKFQGY